MYEPVLDRCVTTTAIEPSSLSNGRGEPPEKPPRRHSRPARRGASRPGSSEDPAASRMRPDAGDHSTDVLPTRLDACTAPGMGQVVDRSTQTGHVAPYRLRFMPTTSGAVKLGPSGGGCALRFGCCCRMLGRWLLSQLGLSVVVVVWALLGALAFFGAEGPRELEQSQKLAKIQESLSVELAEDLQPIEDHPHDARRDVIRGYFQKHEKLFLEAVGAGFGEGGGGTIWTYPGCVLFAVSLLTTLGFGAPVPRTPLGRSAAVVFAAVGIPLHFLLVLNLGHLGAVGLRRLAAHAPEGPKPRWLQIFPFVSVVFFYVLGVVLFGVARGRPAVDCLMFPLDFTAAGGVATVRGCTRVFYALYLEAAVTLAAVVVSLLQAAASRGVVDVGLKWGLLTDG